MDEIIVIEDDSNPLNSKARNPAVLVGLWCDGDDRDSRLRLRIGFAGTIPHLLEYLTQSLPGLTVTAQDVEAQWFIVTPPSGTLMSRADLQRPVYRLARDNNWTIRDQEISF